MNTVGHRSALLSVVALISWVLLMILLGAKIGCIIAIVTIQFEVYVHHFLIVFLLRLFLVTTTGRYYLHLLVQNATYSSIATILSGLMLNFLLRLLRLSLI